MAEAVQPDPQPGQPAQPSALPDSYAFVMNVKSLSGAISFPLIEGHELRRATPIETTRIRDILAGLSYPNPFIHHLWECHWPRTTGR